MPKQDIETTIQFAKELVNHVPEEINVPLKELLSLAQGKSDPMVGAKITDLLSSKKSIRYWLKEQNNLRSGTRGEYNSLPGKSKLPPASQKWVCPINSRDHWLLLIQEDEEAPMCEIDSIKMVRGHQRKG